MKFDIRYTDQLSDHYFKLVTQIHGDSESTRAFLEDSVKGFNTFKTKGTPIIAMAYLHDQIQGHIGLLTSKSDEAFFGFFECLNYQSFEYLWESMIAKARELKINRIFGPVNGTIWHPYRIISKTNGDPYFPSEPISSIEYHTWLISRNPIQITDYHSAYRTNFSVIQKATEKSYTNVINQDYSIDIEKVNQQNIGSLFNLAFKAFSSNPGFTPLHINEFVELYNDQKIDKHQSLIYTVRKNNELIGFSLNHIYNRTLIMKTIAVLPEMQQLGIGNALVYKVHTDAINQGIEKVIYALIRKDNQVKHFPTDHVTIFREYNAYLFEVL